MSKESDKIWRQFCEAFDDAVAECMSKGNPHRLTLGQGPKAVTVDIYRQNESMEKFNDLINSANKDAKVMIKGAQ